MTHSKTVPVRALAWLLMLVMLVSMMPGVPLVAQAAGTEGMITIEMTDTYSDGWSDNAIEIYANGKLVATVTMTSDSPSETWTGKLDPHATYNFKWVEGRYADETGFVIYMGTTEMCSASGSNHSNYDTIFYTAPVCAAPSYEDGVCTKCGTACAHDIDADGQCGICGYICPDHSFVDGACATCGGACPHAAVFDGECKACKGTVNLIIDMTAQCDYGWENCGSITVFADGTEIGVAKLESAYTGSWSVPYSSIYTYTFRWAKEIWPQECSFTVKLGNEVFYTANNDECRSLSDGVFLTINPNCTDHTSFDENFLCNECGLPCTHKAWTDSVCDACGFACGTDAAHDWDLGTCKVCDLSCSHSWTDYVCDTCGFACGTDLNHSFGGDQECDVCGFACGTDAAHDWDLGTCKVCDLSCSHSWTDYVCDTCGFACGTDLNHSFGGDQECDVCGFACGTDSNHAWSKGVCGSCGAVCPHERYENAMCTVCGYYEPAVQNGVGANGFALYEIYNASQLLWFAQYVNSDEVLKTHNFNDGTGETVTYFTTGCLNAKLMADIDMTGLPWSPIGAKDLGSRGYTGVFEGNGHTVSGIDCIVTSDDDVYAGFFRGFHGTVKNLTVRGSFKAVTTATNERAYAGGIAAYCNNSSFYVSGETEFVYPVIENCTFIGTVSAESSKRIYSGGIAGYFGKGTMTNCLAAATVTSNGGGSVRAGALVACDDGSTYTNCYYDSTLCNLDACGNEEITGVTGLATADFADGAVAYALGFGQTLGTDAYPTYGDDQVFQVLNCKEETAYSNTDSNIGHTWATIDCETPITCSTCGATDGDAKGHDWKDATCAAPKTCSNCGATEGYPDYDNHAGEITVVFDWNDPYEGECYVNAYLHCGLCETNISSTSGYGLLTGTVEATDCLNPGSETYEITVELEGQTYTDTHTFAILSENHVGEPVNGFCSACGGYEAAVWNEDEGVYEISNAGQLYWYAQYLNTTNAEIYAELVADIIIPENAPNWEPINASYAYFNGNYHTISGLKCIGDENMTYVGLFGCEGWWYEISNLHIENSYFEGKEYVGAVVACMTNGGSITNCAVTNTIVASDGDYAGTLAGYLSVGSVINCFVDTDTLVGGYSNGYVTIENSYYLSDTETEDGGKTAAQFASGEVAYLLQSGIAEEDIYDEDWNWIGSYIPEIWGQTIGEEAYPTLGGAKVYPRLNCLEEICGYSNTEGESLDHDWIDATCATAKTCKLCGETEGEALEHQFDENGFCILINDGNACDAYEPAELVEGVYQISNAGQLYWFAAQVNSGETSINAKVMNDVTVNTGDVKGCNGTKADGWRTWTPIGNSTEKYTGTFDGGSFTVSGLYFNDPYSSYGGLFGYVGTGTVENVGVVNSYFCAYTSSGGIVGENEGGIVANCYGNICVSAYLSSGGIAGYNAGTVKNCHSNVTLNANYDGGGVVGSNYGAVMNCYSIGSIGGANSGSIVGRLYSDGTVTNCYYDQTGRGGINGSEVAGQAEAKTAEQFASGEVAYLLGETWGQTIGEDDYPVLGGDKVYQTLNCKGETVYSNTEINGAHMWLDATCTESKTCSVCGETEGEALGHDWKAATCTAPKTCLNCGALEGDVDSDNHASTDYIYQYYRNGYFEKHEKFHACCSASVGMENHSYNEQTGLCNQCGAEILIVVEMVNAPTEYLIHVEYALRRGGRSATLLKDYTNTKSYTVAVDELFFAEGVTLTNNGTLVMPEGFDLSTLENNYNGTGVVTIGDASYVWNGEKFVCAGDHSWQDATCTTPKTCDLCKETEGKALGHNYGNDEVCDRCGKFGWIDLLVESYIVEGAENVTVNSDGSWTVTGNITLLPNVTFDYDVFAWLAQTLTADAEVSITVLDMDPNGLYGTNWITLYSLWGDSNAYPAGIHDRIDSIKDVYDFNVEYSGWGNTGTATFRAIYIEPVGTVTLNTLELRTSGCKHSYELIDSSAATCTGNGTATYSCAICGDSYTETIPATGKHVDGDNSGRCDSCGILMQPALLRMVSISLKGNIALNYYMLLSDEVLADSTAYMQFTMADGEVIQLPVSQGVKHEYYGETYYVFSCEVNAKEMTDDVVSQFFYEGGSTEVHSYSVQTYAKSILATSDNEDVKELVKAMLNYGAASQTHFGYNTDNMANAELEEPDYSGVTISGFNTGAGQGTELAKFYSASLILKSETTLRFFFTAPITATYNGQALEVKERGGLYYVDVVGIAARNLDEDVTITINDGVSTAEVSFNPMSYCQGVLNDPTGDFGQEMKDLVSALYLYNQAANEYFKES